MESSDGVTLVVAEQDADRRKRVVDLHVALEVVHVHLHLTQVLMVQFTAFHVPAQPAISEHQIDEEAPVFEAEALLARLDQEALAKRQQELLQAIDDRGFNLDLGIAGLSFRELWNRRLIATAPSASGVPLPWRRSQ